MTNEHIPQESPPSEDAAMVSGIDSKPTAVIGDEAAQTQGEAATMPQIDLASIEEAVGAATVWYNGKKITALWSINENRNSWIGVSGLGWRKLADNSDSGVVALTMLASHAKQGDRTVNLREDDNRIREIYVW